MLLFRCFAWERNAASRAEGGALFFARALQGDGRHDAPDIYGCLYMAERPLAAVVEQLARFRGTPFSAAMLHRRGLPLALATISLTDTAKLVDLDDPSVLVRERLRPSAVATRERSRTQAYARDLYRRHRRVAGIRWWSTFESSWLNVTVYDRGAELLQTMETRVLGADEALLADAKERLGFL